MKKHVLSIGSIIIAALVILLTLNFVSDKPNAKKNGFKRNISSNQATIVKETTVPQNLTKIANISNDTVYLQTAMPGIIYYTNDFKKLDTIAINLPKIQKLETSFQTRVQYPYVYILCGNARVMVVCNALSKICKSYALPTPGPFIGGAYLDSYNIVVRSTDTSNFNADFYKLNYLTGSIVKEKNISPLLKDAGFAHSGELMFDQRTDRLITTEYYCNNIKIFDTLLNLIKEYHTIDTVNTSPIRVKKSANSISNSTPKEFINGTASINNGQLFVRSYLHADNEVNFDGRIVIDRYDLAIPRYIHSFYLPYNSKEKLINIIVDNERLYALFSDKLIQINLPR